MLDGNIFVVLGHYKVLSAKGEYKKNICTGDQIHKNNSLVVELGWEQEELICILPQDPEAQGAHPVCDKHASGSREISSRSLAFNRLKLSVKLKAFTNFWWGVDSRPVSNSS